MALSFTEKQYWKDRTAKTVEAKIRALRNEAAKVLEDLQATAQAEVESELNIAVELGQFKDRAEKIKQLEEEQRDLLSMIASDVYGDDLPYRVDLADIERQMKSLVAERAASLFSQHLLGQHLDTLESERARLLDLVLLANNVQQIGSIMDEAAALSVLPELQHSVQEDGDFAAIEKTQLLIPEYSLQ